MNRRPPQKYDGTPVSHELAAGTTLWRVHSRRYEPAQFNERDSEEYFGGGRFDSTPADSYPYLYGGLAPQTALAEALMRDLPRDDRGYRTLRRPAVKGRSISAMTVVKPLFLVSLLDGPALAAVAQESWLLHADGSEYVQTRAIGHWIRKQAGWAQGFIWNSSRDAGKPALILFGDRRDTATALDPTPSRQIPLDDEPGADWVNATLSPYHVNLRSPRRGARTGV